MRAVSVVILAAAIATHALAADNAHRAAVEEAKRRWAESPHGPMLERILPPYFDPEQLPQSGSQGAQLTVRYCVQCHNLPNPAMHERGKWPGILARMVVRMEGNGNMGTLMHELMAGVQAPSPEEEKVLLAYLQRNAQRPLDPRKYPDIDAPSAQSFRLACQQCHTLPDPQRYTAREWPAVVARMEKNMEWMNRVVGTRRDPTEPQLSVEEIIGYLRSHARAN
jgi:hypothetical protein